jgi:hypothetical protein
MSRLREEARGVSREDAPVISAGSGSPLPSRRPLAAVLVISPPRLEARGVSRREYASCFATGSSSRLTPQAFIEGGSGLPLPLSRPLAAVLVISPPRLEARGVSRREYASCFATGSSSRLTPRAFIEGGSGSPLPSRRPLAAVLVISPPRLEARGVSRREYASCFATGSSSRLSPRAFIEGGSGLPLPLSRRSWATSRETWHRAIFPWPTSVGWC